MVGKDEAGKMQDRMGLQCAWSPWSLSWQCRQTPAELFACQVSVLYHGCLWGAVPRFLELGQGPATTPESSSGQLAGPSKRRICAWGDGLRRPRDGFISQIQWEEKTRTGQAGFQCDTDFISSQKERCASGLWVGVGGGGFPDMHTPTPAKAPPQRSQAASFLALEEPPHNVLRSHEAFCQDPKAAVPPRLCCLASLLLKKHAQLQHTSYFYPRQSPHVQPHWPSPLLTTVIQQRQDAKTQPSTCTHTPLLSPTQQGPQGLCLEIKHPLESTPLAT